MAKLVISMDGVVTKEVQLTKERTTIGRKPHNDVQVDNLAVSGEHAVIYTIRNDSFIEDLDSTNGTLVNGAPIKKHLLKNNDLVELGKHKLKYVSEAAGVATQQDFEKTMVIRNPIVPKPANVDLASKAMTDTAVNRTQILTPLGVKPAETSAAVPEQIKIGAIQVLTGAASGRSLDLVKTLTTIGKQGEQVAVITKRPTGYFITHVEGVNFPLLNGKALDDKPQALNDHDIIELAGVKMEFFLKSL
jgi:pSer/pThr/pTyr-binding forkhead associated (FHA) protein